MAYLTFTEYTDMGGVLSEPAFNRYEFMAEKEIDRETFGRIKTLISIPKAVKMLVYELVQINAKSDVSEDRVTSESVGSWSKTYADVKANEIKSLKMNLITDYLSEETDENGIPLLYRGC